MSRAGPSWRGIRRESFAPTNRLTLKPPTTNRGPTKAPIPFLDLVSPHRVLADELIAAFHSALHPAAFGGGAEVAGSGRPFATFPHSNGTVAVNSGPDALRLAAQ